MKGFLIGIGLAALIFVGTLMYFKAQYKLATQQDIQIVEHKLDSLRADFKKMELKLDSMQLIDIKTNANTDTIKSEIRDIKNTLNEMNNNKNIFLRWQ